MSRPFSCQSQRHSVNCSAGRIAYQATGSASANAATTELLEPRAPKNAPTALATSNVITSDRSDQLFPVSHHMPPATIRTTGTAARTRAIRSPARTPPANPPSTSRSIRGGTNSVVPPGNPFRYVAANPATNQAITADGIDHR